MEFLEAERLERFTEWLKKDGQVAAGLHRIGEADGHVVYAFGPAPPTVGFDALTLPAIVLERRVQTVATPGQTIEFVIRNLGRRSHDAAPAGTYITTLRLHDAEGPVVGRQRVAVAASTSPERDSPSAGGDLAHPG
jgi:hypothetical protein